MTIENPNVDNQVDVLVSFDSTGSMAPCLSQVRKNITNLVLTLAKKIPGIHLGIIAHGDYCDARETYTIKAMDFSIDEKHIANFVNNVEATYGGDAAECYELVLREAQDLSWRKDAKKILVMIGDATPHSPTEAQNKDKIDWRKELVSLAAKGISVYSVQCMGNHYAEPFWREMAEKTGGFHLPLDQFVDCVNMLIAVACKQAGNETLQNFETELSKEKRLNRNMMDSMDILFGRKTSTSKKAYGDVGDLLPVESGRFQILDVDVNSAIKEFVLKAGVPFKIGRGFYQFTKPEDIQKKKEVVLRSKKSGDLFTGAKAREMLGLPPDETVRLRPVHFEEWDVFVQSTSVNRKLMAGTQFLYEVDKSR